MKSPKKLPNIPALLKGHFLSGLLIVLPLAVILWLLSGMWSFLWHIQQLFPEAWQPQTLFNDSRAALLWNFVFTLGAAFVLALAISILGWGSKLFLGRKILGFIGDIIEHIPVVRSVYSALDQLLKTIGSGGGSKQFNRVVYIEYPRKGVWALAFVTGPAKGPAAPAGFLNVYVPTTPNPTSGFHLLVAENEVRESQLRVEEAFRTILSLGIAQ